MPDCTHCHTDKPIDQFFIYPKTGKVRQPCKKCNGANGARWKRAHPESRKKYSLYRRIHRLKEDYGLTPLEYTNLLKDQKGGCAICGNTEGRKLHRIAHTGFTFIVDHDHATGAIRGLLCDTCNRALGMFKDSVPVLQAAVKYLKKYARNSNNPGNSATAEQQRARRDWLQRRQRQRSRGARAE